MEKKQLENPIEEDHGNNDLDSLEEPKNCERNESLFGLARGKICESCKKIENCTPIGQSIRRCQACARIKSSFEKKPFQVELEREERSELDCDVKDEPITIATTNFIIEMNTKLEDNLNDSKEDLSNEYFAVEHEHNDLLGANVVKVPSSTNSEDGKVILKKKDNLALNRKEYKPSIVSDAILKRDKNGYLKGRPLLDKDVMVTNERKEPTIETLDSQKTKEEIELERRERGWNVNGSIIGKRSNYSKVAPTKSLATLDGCLLGKEQRERVKVKSLKEKQDTQRILGLVAKRSESRINSPTHRNPNLSYNRNEEVETPYAVTTKSNVVPSIIIHEKNPETSKLQESLNLIATNSEIASNCDETRKKPYYTSVEGKSSSQFPIPQEDTKSQCLSPTNLCCYSNENTLFGTQRILELLAKRNGSRVTSPTQNLEMSAHINKSNNKTYCESKEQKRTKNADITSQSSQLHDHQQENLITLTCTTKSSYNEQVTTSKNNSEKILDFCYGISSNAPNSKKQQEFDHHNTSSTNANFQHNDNKVNNTHQVLEMVAQRNENGTIPPKKSTYYNLKDESLPNSKGNKFDYLNVTSELIPSRSIENQEPPSIEIIPSTSILCNHSIVHKENKGEGETTSHANVDTKISKRNYEEAISSPNSPKLEFSTPSNTICHVNDNPLYGTKFESEPISCTSNSTNKSCSYTSNQSPSPLVAQKSLNKPLRNTSKEALEICFKRIDSKETCSALALNKQSIYNSMDISPLYKSAVATPICKSPTNRINGRNPFQIEPKYHAKEVEIVEEDQNLTLENKRDEELNTKNLNKDDERLKLENGRALEELHGTNLIGKSGNTMVKECCKEKPNLYCNPKASSHKIMFKTFWWPIQFIFGILICPFKLLLRLVFYVFYLFKVLIFGIVNMFKKSKHILVLSVGNIRTKFLENFQTTCNNTQGYSRCGCASKTYILVVLSSLLIPSLFDLDFYLVNRFIEGQVVIREALNFDYTKEHPTASVNLLPHQIMSKAKGYFLDKDVTTAHAFPPSYIFNIIVHLTLPESQYNQDIGMFQIVIETFSARGHSLNKASRSSMLRYYSPPVKYMKSIILGIPVVLGLSQESQTLSIKMMESQEDNEHSPTASVNVEIEPKVGHVTGLGVPEIYHAELQVIAHNPYFRDVARNWVWNLYVYSGFALFVFEVLLVLYCCQRAFPQKEVGSKKKHENKKTVFEKGQKFVTQAPIIKRLHKGQIYYSKSLPLALPNISNINDSRNTLSCSESKLEEFKVIRLSNEPLFQKSCKIS